MFRFPNHVTCAPRLSRGGQAERWDEQAPEEEQSRALVALKAQPSGASQSSSLDHASLSSTS